VSDELERTRAIVTLTIVGTFTGPPSDAWLDRVVARTAQVAGDEASAWLNGVTVSALVETGGTVTGLDS
jgi:hypothetical protein